MVGVLVLFVALSVLFVALSVINTSAMLVLLLLDHDPDPGTVNHDPDPESVDSAAQLLEASLPMLLWLILLLVLILRKTCPKQVPLIGQKKRFSSTTVRKHSTFG